MKPISQMEKLRNMESQGEPALPGPRWTTSLAVRGKHRSPGLNCRSLWGAQEVALCPTSHRSHRLPWTPGPLSSPDKH